MTYDVRAIANFVLDLASGQETPVTNVFINKIVYFIHADSLVERQKGLVTAKIEAWTYGPVFRELYAQFRDFGSAPITVRAKRFDPAKGVKSVCSEQLTPGDMAFVEERARYYLKIDPFVLVDMSHAAGGPWDKAFNHSGRANPGMEITEELIGAHHRGEQVQ